MFIPLLLTNHYQQNFFYQGPKLWNLILPYIKDKDFNLPVTIQQVKKRLKRFLLEMQSFGPSNDWLDTNFYLDKYNIIKVKDDSHLYDSMHSIAIKSAVHVLENSEITN